MSDREQAELPRPSRRARVPARPVPGRRLRGAGAGTACWSARHRRRQDRRRRVRRPPRPGDGRKCFYTTPIKALSNQKYPDLVARPRRRPRSACSPATTRSTASAGGRDDDRGAAQHALRRVADARRARLRRDGRGALPGRPVPRRGVGGGHHPPARATSAGVAVGDGVQRRGVRRLAGRRCAGDRGGGGRAPAGAAVAAHAGRASGMYDLFADEASTRPTAAQMRRAASTRASSPAQASRRRVDPPSGPPGRGGRGRWQRSRAAAEARSRVGPAAAPGGATRAEVIERLDREGLLPAITFIFSRAGCDAAVEQCSRRPAADHRGGARARSGGSVEERVAQHRRRGSRPSWATGSGVEAWSGDRRPPRRHAARVQGDGRGAVRPRPGQGGVRHRDAGARHQHAGPHASCSSGWSSSTARPTST